MPANTERAMFAERARGARLRGSLEAAECPLRLLNARLARPDGGNSKLGLRGFRVGGHGLVPPVEPCALVVAVDVGKPPEARNRARGFQRSALRRPARHSRASFLAAGRFYATLPDVCF